MNYTEAERAEINREVIGGMRAVAIVVLFSLLAAAALFGIIATTVVAGAAPNPVAGLAELVQ